MKAVMYHYVRPGNDGLPYFRYLHVDDFRRQLADLGREYGFVDRRAFLNAVRGGGSCGEGVVLTFDDGLRDHYAYVLPELRRRGLWGLFYVPTGVYQRAKALNVHCVHHLIGRYGGAAMLTALQRLVTDEMMPHARISAFRRVTYVDQDDDAATLSFKRALNYFIAPRWQDVLLDRLMQECGERDDDLIERLYATPAMLVEMQRDGMIIGGHGVTHRVLSALPVAEQAAEIRESFAFLEDITGSLAVRTFAYPYGGFHSFTRRTERLLTLSGCACSFNVEARDITAGDLRTRPQALPRFDCNAFRHGRASIGASRGADAVPPSHATTEGRRNVAHRPTARQRAS